MKGEIIVPDNLNEISLKQYQKFVKIQEKMKARFFCNKK